MLTITKVYPELPFAHRQPTHDGHCSLIHGHSWTFALTFKCNILDKNGFIADFGDLKWIKVWLEHHFDHTLVLNDNDPLLAHLKSSLEDNDVRLADIITVPNCGAEGLAKYVGQELNKALCDPVANPNYADYATRGVYLISVEVYEDSKNSARWTL